MLTGPLASSHQGSCGLLLKGRGVVEMVEMSIAPQGDLAGPRQLGLAAELRGTFEVWTDGTGPNPFQDSDPAASAVLAAAIRASPRGLPRKRVRACVRAPQKTVPLLEARSPAGSAPHSARVQTACCHFPDHGCAGRLRAGVKAFSSSVQYLHPRAASGPGPCARRGRQRQRRCGWVQR